MAQKPLEIEEELDRLPSVTQILTATGILPVYPDTEAARWARAWGEYLHQLLAKVAIGEQLPEGAVVADAEPYVQHFGRWLREAQEAGWKVEATEKPITHFLDGFSGRIDLLLVNADTWWVIELKTGRPHPAHRVQTAAYVHGVGRFTLDDLTRGSERLERYRRGALYLSPTDAKYRDHNIRDGDYVAWSAALALYRWKRQKYYDSLGKTGVMEI
jgi:hypothetical protein